MSAFLTLGNICPVLWRVASFVKTISTVEGHHHQNCLQGGFSNLHQMSVHIYYFADIRKSNKGKIPINHIYRLFGGPLVNQHLLYGLPSFKK